MPTRDEQILRSWQANAAAWVNLLDKEGIESRTLVTNQAIVDAVAERRPRRVLDLGCGEGWLSRALNARGIEATGVDATEALIAHALQQGGGAFHRLTYEAIIAGAGIPGEPFDLIAINFGLFAEAETGHLLQALHRHLVPEGILVIQTLHPYSQIAAGKPYRSGWQSNVWQGLEGDFSEPHEWYFRTLEDWLRLLSGAGYALLALKEPLHPRSGQPASVIFSLRSFVNQQVTLFAR